MQNDDRKCPHCQAVLEADAIFCVECGNTTNISESAKKTVVIIQEIPPIVSEIKESLYLDCNRCPDSNIINCTNRATIGNRKGSNSATFTTARFSVSKIQPSNKCSFVQHN